MVTKLTLILICLDTQINSMVGVSVSALSTVSLYVFVLKFCMSQLLKSLLIILRKCIEQTGNKIDLLAGYQLPRQAIIAFCVMHVLILI